MDPYDRRATKRDTSDRRVKRRAHIHLEINYIHEEDFLISHSRDISADGMFIFTENPSSVNEQVTLKFSLENSGEFTVKAQVVWVNDSENKKNRGMGVKFIDTSDEFNTAILSIVNKVAVIEENK